MPPRGKDPRAKEPSNRPGWKGPSYIKKTKPTPPKAASSKEKSVTSTGDLIPLELQQLLLNIFSNTFSEILRSNDLYSILQEVKQALFEREFDKAFGTEEYLESYAARYSPTRALCYTQVLVEVWKHMAHQSTRRKKEDVLSISTKKDQCSSSGIGQNSAIKVICFGGAAAEVVAFGGLLSYLNSKSWTLNVDDSDSLQKTSDSDEAKSTPTKLLLIDTAAWGGVVRKLSEGLEAPPTLSKYASASAKANNPPLIPKDLLITSFQQADALGLSKQEISKMLGEVPTLITLLFTLNELYTSSISKTTTFLLHLTAASKPGTLLLVVDSPGSYSETAIGKDSKKYPMQWLLDHTLLEKTKLDDAEESSAWEKVVSEDSEWFRLAEKLRYPIALEDMRYQIHLYRRV